MGHDRNHLKRTRRIAQIVAAVSVVAAGVVGAVGIPGIGVEDQHSPVGIDRPTGGSEQPATDQPGTEAPSPSYNTALIAGQFAQFGNSPRPAPPTRNEEEELAGGEAEPSTPIELLSPSTETELRYIGKVASGNTVRAALVIGDVQKFLSTGRSFRGVTLVEIEDDHVIIDDDGVSRRIDREGSTMTRVETTRLPDAIANAAAAKPEIDRRTVSRANTPDAAKSGTGNAAVSAASSLAGLTGEARERRLQELREMRERQAEMGVDRPQGDDQ